MDTVSKQSYYLITMRKHTAKERARFFIVTDKRLDLGTGYVSGRGYWAEAAPSERKVDVCADQLEEVMIPWSEIEYVRNLTYLGR